MGKALSVKSFPADQRLHLSAAGWFWLTQDCPDLLQEFADATLYC